MLQTLGTSNPKTPIITSGTSHTSTPTSTHWDKSRRAFLWKKNDNTLLAIFKIKSNALYLKATLNRNDLIKYINLDIFLPNVKEFRTMGLTTKGLLGLYDDNPTNDCKHRNGNDYICEDKSPAFHSCEFNINFFEVLAR